jgi:hypothetical protein
MIHDSFESLVDDVDSALDFARDEAERSCGPGVLRQRMTEFIASDGNEYLTESGCWEWKATEATTNRDIAEIQRRFPNVESIALQGGFDWAEDQRAMADHDYEPWASEFRVTVWHKEA